MTKDDKKIVRNVILFCIIFSVFFTVYRIATLLEKQSENKKSDNVTAIDNINPSQNVEGYKSVTGYDNLSGYDNIPAQNIPENNIISDNSSSKEANAKGINDLKTFDNISDLNQISNPYDNLDNMLYDAVLKGDFESVRRYVSMGANINSIDNNGNTIIYRMALQKDLNMDQLNSINYLLVKGADANKANYDGYTPLTAHLSSNLFNKEFIDRLLKYHAEVNATDFEGDTPLHYAVMNNNLDAVTYLIDNGANVNVKNKDSITPLHIAVEQKNYDITGQLLHNDADRNTKNIDNISALDMAKASGDVDLYRLFSITKEDLEKDKIQEELMQAINEKMGLPAVSAISENVAKGFINRPIKQDKGSSSIEGKFVGENPTPLIAALYFNYNDIAKALIKAGADVNKPNDYPYYSPLMVASDTNNIEMVKELINKGANINYASKMDGITALNVADKADIAEVLLKSGADANVIANKSCLSPLQLAVINNNYDLAETLLKYGANANHVDCNEYKPVIANAIDTANPALVRLLLQYNAGVNTEIGEDLSVKVIDYAKSKGNQLIIDMIEERIKATAPKKVDMGIETTNDDLIKNNVKDDNQTLSIKDNISAKNNVDNKTVNTNKTKDNKTNNAVLPVQKQNVLKLDNKSGKDNLNNLLNNKLQDNQTLNMLENQMLNMVDNKTNEIDNIMNNIINDL